MNQVLHTQVGKGNRIGLPAPVCQELGLKPGTRITVVIDEMGIHLTTDQQALKMAQDLFTSYLKPGDESPSEELLRHRREEASRE